MGKVLSPLGGGIKRLRTSDTEKQCSLVPMFYGNKIGVPFIWVCAVNGANAVGPPLKECSFVLLAFLFSTWSMHDK